MFDPTFWAIVLLYSMVAFITGHQGSHAFSIKTGLSTLNPVLTLLLGLYSLPFPILFLIWIGYKTIWWYAVSIFFMSLIFRLIWTKITIETGLVKSAWAISLLGIIIIPFLLFGIVKITLWSTDTSTLFEFCRKCPTTLIDKQEIINFFR